MNYPKKFNATNLDKDQQLILAAFFQRRKLFDRFLIDNNIELYTCPGCGYPTLTERGGYEICIVCSWEDDNQDDKEADEIWGGPNCEISLTENRLNIGEQLTKMAEEIGGRINNQPNIVVDILTEHKNKISDLLTSLPEEVDLNHPIIKVYKEKGQGLLRQLVTT